MNWVINLDENIEAPTKNVSLLTMLKLTGSSWPEGATCATQEQDGEILYWSASVDAVTEARQKPLAPNGLMSLLGIRHQLHADYYEVDDIAYVSNDWKTSVVTLEMFKEQLPDQL